MLLILFFQSSYLFMVRNTFQSPGCHGTLNHENSDFFFNLFLGQSYFKDQQYIRKSKKYIEMYKRRLLEEFAHVVMEAEKSHDLPTAGCRTKKAVAWFRLSGKSGESGCKY